MLDLYKLEIFVYVAEEGSFSGVAERLLMTQSGVSQHISKLEATLGTHLFVRARRGVTLTVAGKRLYEYAQRILALVAETENAITDVAKLTAGQVKIGATPGVAVYILPEWIQSFHRRYPKLTVTSQTKITAEIVADLLAGRFDLAIVEGEVEEDMQRRIRILPLQIVEQMVIVGQHHPFWQRQEVSIEELNQQPFIMRQANSQTRIWLDQVLQRYQIEPKVNAEFDTVESIKRFVALGHGLTILPDYAVRDEQAYGVLRAVPIKDQPLQRTLRLLWDGRRFFSPVTRALLAHLQSRFPTISDLLYI
jgi:LysR family transcriptional regulator, low CO2-responsive transcriptional regulator